MALLDPVLTKLLGVGFGFFFFVGFFLIRMYLHIHMWVMWKIELNIHCAELN